MRTLIIAGKTLAQYGLVMLQGSKPYVPAAPKTAFVDIPGSSTLVDGTEFSTGRVEFAAVDGEYADCMVVPSLLGYADTDANIRSVTQSVVAALDGQAVDIVDSDYPSHWLDARCTVTVDEVATYGQLRISWTRQAVRRKAGGSADVTGISWTQDSLPYVGGDVDVESCHLLGVEPTGLDWTECAWAWDEVTAKPEQPGTTPDTPTITASTTGGVSWNGTTRKATTSSTGTLTVSVASAVGCTASELTNEVILSSSLVFVNPSAYIHVKAMDANLGTLFSTYISTMSNMSTSTYITIPEGCADIEFEITVESIALGASITIDMAAMLAALETAFYEYGPAYGDPDFDYAGYYEYVDGTGMVDASTLLSPTWALGGVYLPSDTVSALPADFHSLYPSPTFSADLLYAAFTDYTATKTITSTSSYEYPLEIAANVDCTVELDGRSVTVAGTGDTYTTDIPVPNGSSTVSVTIPYGEPSDGGAASVALTWKQGDV